MTEPPDAAELLGLVARDVLTDVVEAAMLELSWGTERHVRTPGGVRMYNEPIGTLITFHMRKKARETHGTEAEASVHAQQDTSRKAAQQAPATAPKHEPPTGAQAVHPAVRAPIKRPGDTISGLAYKHTPKPSGYPWAKQPAQEPQTRHLEGPGGMKGRVNPDGSVETQKWDGSWGPAQDPEHVANTWVDRTPGHAQAEASARNSVGQAVLEHLTAKAQEAEAKRYTMPDHAGPLTDDEVQDRLRYIERTTSDAMHKYRSTDYTQALNAPDTKAGYIWKPGRATQHNAIVKALMDKYSDVPREGQAVIAGGVPGAGKSTVLRSLPDKYMPIDADEIKGEMAARGMIPKLKGLSPMEAAPLVHEESRHISALLAQRAYAEHRNVAWDITMAGRGSPTRHLADLNDAGYDNIKGVFVHADPETAIKRTQDRYRKGLEDYRAGKGDGGRYLPSSAITGNAAGARSVFEGLKDQFDSAEVYDTTKGKPELVSRYAPLTDAEMAQHREQAGDAVAKALQSAKSTRAANTLRGGKVYKPERAAEHNKIVADYVKRSVSVPSASRAVIVGGPPGSRRESVAQNAAGKGDYVVVGPDQIKYDMAKRGLIPEVKGASPLEASPLAHEEAAHITSLVQHELYRRKKNVMLSMPMTSAAAAEHQVAVMHGHGYKVGMIYAKTAEDKAVARARQEHRQAHEQFRQGKGPGGRLPTSSYIRKLAADSEKAFEQAKAKADRWSKFENGKLLTEHNPPAPKDVLSTEEIVRKLERGTM